jgi:hypothetical protein
MFAELIGKLGEILGAREVPYMIIGGQAVLLYGEPRLTRDIDITLGIGAERFPDILDMAEHIGLHPLPDDIGTFVKQTMVLPMVDDTTGIRVDFIFSFTPYEHEAIRRSRKVRFGSVEVSFASPEDVIIHKIFAGRPRDLEDIRGIILKNPDIDEVYIGKWLLEFEKSSGESGFVDLFQSVRK